MSSGDGQKAQTTTESYNKRWGVAGWGREEHTQSGNGIITSNDISQEVTALETQPGASELASPRAACT